MKFSIDQRRSASEHIRFDGEFSSGARVALLGPSGAGKTTLLRYLAGLERKGQVYVRSPSGEGLPAWKSDSVYLHQSPVMFAHHRVEQTIKFAQRYARTDRLPMRDWADHLELTELWSRPTTELSGGQQQRVALLRALATGKPWLLLDEAFSALDGARLLAACDVVHDYCQRTGAGLILASHQDRPQRILCHEAFVVNDLVGRAEPDLFAALNQRIGEPRKSTLDVLLGEHEHGFLRAACEGASLFLNPPTRWREGPARVSIAATDISIAIGEDHQTSMVNRLPVVIDQIRPVEGRTLLRLRLGAQRLDALISDFSTHRLALEINQPVFAEFKVGAVEWDGQVPRVSS